MTDANIIEPAAIKTIRDIGGDELLAKLIELFGDYVAGRIAAARQAMESGNLIGVQDAVHPVKSSAANLGAGRVRELARQIEQLAKSRRGEPIPRLLDELAIAFHQALGRLQELQAKNAGD